MNPVRYAIETAGGPRHVGISKLRAMVDGGEIARTAEVLNLRTLERRQAFEVLNIAKNRSESETTTDVLETTQEMHRIGTELLRILKP